MIIPYSVRVIMYLFLDRTNTVMSQRTDQLLAGFATRTSTCVDMQPLPFTLVTSDHRLLTHTHTHTFNQCALA